MSEHPRGAVAPRARNEPAAIAALEEGPVRLRHVLGVSALALVASSCSLEVAPNSGNTINVFIDISDPQLTVGQEFITFTATARNVGNSVLTLTGPSDCLLFVEVRDTQGSMVWNSNGSCVGAIVTVELAVGADRFQSFTWNGTNLAGALLAPGLYNVRAVARVTGGAYVSPPASVALD